MTAVAEVAAGATYALPLRVYYQDTDAGGVVYHSRYLDFFERARYEWLRGLGYGCLDLAGRLGVIFVVRSLAVTFRRPARLDDLLHVSVRLVELGRSRVQVQQAVKRGDETLVEADVELACVDAGTFKPVAVPPALRALMNP
ncbi:MAG TPA: tol-pal system-associated acyl-CoA thioesterase [Pelomicrobium sp.]|nr:tol-pal system-associated acyl-CoA thioesterase [Pelomicrobium sp.]